MRYFSRRGSLAGFLRTLPGLPWDRANPMVFTRDAFQTCYRSSLRSSSRRILIVPFSILVDGKPSFLPSSPPPMQRNVTGAEFTRRLRFARFFHRRFQQLNHGRIRTVNIPLPAFANDRHMRQHAGNTV